MASDYLKLATRVRESGREIRLETSGFRNIERRDFATARVKDFSSDPPVRYLALNVYEEHAPSGLVGSTIEPEWTDHEVADWTFWNSKTLEEAFAVVQKEEGRPFPDCLTSFVVDLEFAGESRHYRAFVTWFQQPDGSARYATTDYYIASGDAALVQPGPFASREKLKEMAMAEMRRAAGAPPG